MGESLLYSLASSVKECQIDTDQLENISAMGIEKPRSDKRISARERQTHFKNNSYSLFYQRLLF
jgi:hypothetical protein